MDHPPEKEIYTCKRFGTIAVKRGFLTKDQLKAAMMEQLDGDLNGKDHLVIGAILFKKNWITWEQIDLVLKEIFQRED